jgi:serine/threonine protein phosphatase PrpC
MAFELEALVGHLFVVGGRTIKTTPPGALCEVAPKKAARGREIDTFFTLVLPAGNVAPNTFYEQMALMAAERYFSNTGSVTSALRDVFNTLNSNLFEHNASGRKRYEAHMIAVVMRGKDLYVARAGAATLILRHNAETKTIPDDLSDDAKLYKPTLGVQPIPEVEMSRMVLDRGSRMLLADSSVREIAPDKLTQTLLGTNLEQVLDDLKLLVTLQIQMMAVEFVPPEMPVSVPVVTGQSSAVLLAEIAAARAKTATQQIETLDENEEEAPTPSPAARPKRENSQDRLKERSKAGVATVARSTGTSLTRIGMLAAKLFGTSENAERRRRNASLIAVAMILIPTAVIGIVMMSWVANVGQTNYEECVARATDAYNTARTMPTDNRNAVLSAWDITTRIVGECRDLRPDYEDPNLNAIEDEGLVAIDGLSNITRRDATLVWSAPSGSNLREIVLEGLTIYALDSNSSIVYRVQLSSDGLAVSNPPQPLMYMSAGSRLEGVTIGRIIGIASDGTRVIAVDETGKLITCLPLSINDCEIQQLQEWDVVQNPVRIELWEGRLYILDIGAAQVWRFQSVGNTNDFSNRPTELYSEGVRPANLDQAVDFDIGYGSLQGNIFILYADGTMTRHFGTSNVGFSFSGFPDTLAPPEVATTQAMYLNDNVIGTGFYLISRPTSTIYSTTAAGTFQAAYRVSDERLFERLNDVAVDAEEGLMYAASGNIVMVMPLE